MNFEWTQELQYLFHKGRYFQAYEAFGAHITEAGVRFCIWVPHVKEVVVVGDFNDWEPSGIPMKAIDESHEIWQVHVPEAKAGDRYKYHILTQQGKKIWKMDPYGRMAEVPPGTASIITDFRQIKRTKASKKVKEKRSGNKIQPINIYEVHVGSWKDGCDSYGELARELPAYLAEHGYTHVELMPVMHHPFGGSWGYQVTNFFAPNADWGTPLELRKLIDAFHEAGIAVILDWVPGHFCKNEEGPSEINGGYVYESAEHPEWGTKRFQLNRTEVISFLVSNAAFWFDYYDIDGIRVDGVASMLRPETTYDQDAIGFLQLLNESIFGRFPYAIMAAEDSTAYPNVTKPVFAGGLGFNYKWNMGWMNDTLSYFSRSPEEKRKHHHELTFSSVYAYQESFILPFSHDEVVHGKKTLLDRMPGNYDEKFALLRVLYLYMMTHPGKKLTFMGNEFAPFLEWRYNEGLEWKMLKYDLHRYFYRYLDALNHYYLKDKALWEVDHKSEGFEWIDADNADQSVYIYKRNALDPENFTIVILNAGHYEHDQFRIGVPTLQKFRMTFTSYGGQKKLKKTMQASYVPFHGQPYSVCLHLPALTGIIIKPIKKRKKRMRKND